VERVARQLVKTAKLKRMVISYKSDEQTLDGTYQWNADPQRCRYGHQVIVPESSLAVPKRREQ
jgi:hypothetical protein